MSTTRTMRTIRRAPSRAAVARLRTIATHQLQRMTTWSHNLECHCGAPEIQAVFWTHVLAQTDPHKVPADEVPAVLEQIIARTRHLAELIDNEESEPTWLEQSTAARLVIGTLPENWFEQIGTPELDLAMDLIDQTAPDGWRARLCARCGADQVTGTYYPDCTEPFWGEQDPRTERLVQRIHQIFCCRASDHLCLNCISYLEETREDPRSEQPDPTSEDPS